MSDNKINIFIYVYSTVPTSLEVGLLHSIPKHCYTNVEYSRASSTTLSALHIQISIVDNDTLRQ